MGKCWNCGCDVFLKEEEVYCDRCKVIVRYWCNQCKKPFDVQNKETKKKLKECKWCFYFICPNCNSCSYDCPKHEHYNKIKQILNNLIPIDKWQELNEKVKKIIDYFEDIKLGKEKTTCEFGVPKTYAKERIKQILARMEGFKVRDFTDQEAFEKRREEILDEEEGYEFTIGKTREAGSYGQEYRDVFNLSVCLGKLEHQRKSFKNDKGIEISYDSWTRTEEKPCEFLDVKEIIVKSCPKCKKVYSNDNTYCSQCVYTQGSKRHEKGSHFKLIKKLSNNPICKNLKNFKKEGKKNGETKNKGND